MSAPGSSRRFEAIGTVWEIETDAAPDAAVHAEVDEVIAAFDLAWSRFRPDSLVSSLAAEPREVAAPPDAADMLDAYVALDLATNGAVQPLVGRSLEALGYDAGYTLRPGDPASAPEDWRRILTWSQDRLALAAPAVIDVGALGKGRLVDLVHAAVAPTTGNAVVDAGGDIRVAGRPLRIALEHPYDRTRAIGVVEVADAALCASATNRRAWGDGLHHVLDARTGMPVTTYAATWALAPTAMIADAAATALFFEGGPELAHEWGVEWVRMTTDGRVQWSPGNAAELFV